MEQSPSASDISIVIQGPLRHDFTFASVSSLRALFPESEIILSTYEGSNVQSYEPLVDAISLCADPGDIPQVRLYANGSTKRSLSNLKRQAITTARGLAIASRRYAMKMRSDALLTSRAFLPIFVELSRISRASKFSILNERVLIHHLYTTDGAMPFHFSNAWQFGLAEDLRSIWTPELYREELSLYRLTPEQEVYYPIGLRLGAQRARALDCPDYLHLSNAVLANNFIVIDRETIGFVSEKHAPERWHEETCVRTIDWLKLAREHCDNSIVIDKILKKIDSLGASKCAPFSQKARRKHLAVLGKLAPASVQVNDQRVLLAAPDVRVSDSASGEIKGITELFKRELRSSMVVIDVGAWQGLFSLLAAAIVGQSGQVIAIEPDARNAKILKSAIELNELGNIHPLAGALSNQICSRTLWMYPENLTMLSRFEEEVMADHLDSELRIAPHSSIPVGCMTLPHVCSALSIGTVNLLILDVGGHEPEILSASAPMVSQGNIERILIRASAQPSHRPSAKPACMDFLSSHGYAIEALNFGPNSPIQSSPGKRPPLWPLQSDFLFAKK